MKVSLITIKGIYNYGAVLQGYATYKYLAKQNKNVEVIDYFPEYFEKDTPLYKRILIQILTYKKRMKINQFLKKYMILTNRKYKNNLELTLNTPQADTYIVGSDQVWNSQLSKGELDPAFFLAFAKDKKKISYSSSIGRTDVTKEELLQMKSFLKDFEHVAVREKSAKDLLEGVGVNNVTNVLDPVFLLEIEDYKRFIKPLEFKKYVLIYSFEKNPLIEKIAQDLAREKGLQVIELGIFYSKYKNDKYIHSAGIEDFLSLIYYSDFVITSSFHGTAFSLLLNKQFVSVAPSTRRTRLENITGIFEVSNRLISDENQYSLKDITQPLDYVYINKLITHHSQKSRDYLDNAIR